MFYFLWQAGMTYNLILILAAVIPALILMVRVWRKDKLEKESPELLRRYDIKYRIPDYRKGNSYGQSAEYDRRRSAERVY